MKYSTMEYSDVLAIEKSIKIQMDGNMFCATFEDFTNLQESPAGFGETIGLAISDLMQGHDSNSTA